MNQKLRTAHISIAIVVAILCIVCLSVSLALSAHFAAYAEGETEVASSKLPDKDSKGNDLWQIHYTNSNKQQVVESLWDGIHDGEAITYLKADTETNAVVVAKGTAEEINCFTPYRGVKLTIELNPAYEIDNQPLSDLYDFTKISYDHPQSVQSYDGGDPLNLKSASLKTIVTVPSKTAGGTEFSATKDWTIVPLCNTLADSTEKYVENRGFALEANYPLIHPVKGTDVVYDFQSKSGFSKVIVARFDGMNVEYFHGIHLGGFNYEVSNTRWTYDNEQVAAEHGFINYTIRHLKAGDYTLKVAAMSIGNSKDSDIYYAGSGVSYNFTVSPQPIEDLNFLEIFGSIPEIKTEGVIYYTGDSSWVPTIKLNIGSVQLTQGSEFKVVAESYDVGWVDLRIVGDGVNLTGSYTIENVLEVLPAVNDWVTLPNITSWSYGDYDKFVNKIVGAPLFPSLLDEEHIDDITFRIVAIDAAGVESAIAGLENIHYEVTTDDNGRIQCLVSDDVAKILSELHMGNYRLIASVYGINVGSGKDRNYQPVREGRVDFEVRMGNNSWGQSTVPTIVTWTAGKYDAATNVIAATDRFGNDALILIKNSKGDIVYSNHPDHESQTYGVYGKGDEYAEKLLKSFKAGYYTLRAEVKGADDYNALNTLIDFVIARNGLPTWAVILIVAGSLGIVALVFSILHQKGVLQLLTGKVIIAMRTRANVDATIAAVRAAKVAREAEASVAAAKAREAEEEQAKNATKKKKQK